MFNGLLKGLRRPSHVWSPITKDQFARDELAFAESLRQRSADFDRNRTEILLAGGDTLHSRPTAGTGREAAIQRLMHEGELRESMEYGAFPTPRTYRYTLTPRGERAAAELRAAMAPAADEASGNQA